MAKIQNEEANVELIAPYAAPAPRLCKIKLSVILLVLIVLRLIMLGIFCLPWSIHNLIVIYHPRKGVGRNLYWGTGLSLEALFEPVKFTGGYNTDRFREVISYIYIADCSFHLIVALVGFFTVNLKTIMVLCIIWLIWGLMSLGVFVWGFVRFALRKQFLRMICRTESKP
ncbi:hypothetical protein Ocin01_15930 [Orchesella cincta]|uniref:Uncharacterized protein n=1 Tax=Orchesella cincta TaxID=48709 RepID=A0A1D2MCW1_ORCCI|nr:hypothetical protein Ocin01_15930 [Orchesella cincta]